jgi:hypothetical protein
MTFEFRIPTDSISNSVFPSIRHLNLTDKIISHVIQMNSNLRSLNYSSLDLRRTR